MKMMTKPRAAIGVVIMMTMIAASLALTPAVAAADEGESEGGTFIVTFTNLTNGQPMTPPVVALHDDDSLIWRTGRRATSQIEAIAEGGNNAPLLAQLAADADFTDVGVAGSGPFGPGESVSVELTTDDDHDVLSSLNMLICTNDGITGVRKIDLPEEGSTTVWARAYDAGTEKNTNRSGDVPPAPPCAGLNPGGGGDQDAIAQHKKIKKHKGLHGFGALDFAKKQDVIEVTIERVAEPVAQDYTISFTNLTAGQPMTPPVVAIHDASLTIFDIGGSASAGVEAIAEGGDNSVLLAMLAGLADVSAHGVAGSGPFGPAETVDVTLTTEAEGHVLSAVNMLVCTNDGFTGLHNIELPESGTDMYWAITYDAGTEINTFLAGDVPGAPPCAALPAGGGGDQDLLTEGGTIGAHPGLSGAGSLDFVSGSAVLTIGITADN